MLTVSGNGERALRVVLVEAGLVWFKQITENWWCHRKEF